MIHTKNVPVVDDIPWTRWAEYMLSTGKTFKEVPKDAYDEKAPIVKHYQKTDIMVDKIIELLGLHHPLISVVKNEIGGLTENNLKRLIQACHPDKHNNSELSQEITKWLILKKL